MRVLHIIYEGPHNIDMVYTIMADLLLWAIIYRSKFISHLQFLLAFRPSRKLETSEICAKKMVYDTARLAWYQVPDGLGVRIPGFHPGGPGSIPGLGAFFLIELVTDCKLQYKFYF